MFDRRTGSAASKLVYVIPNVKYIPEEIGKFLPKLNPLIQSWLAAAPKIIKWV